MSTHTHTRTHGHTHGHTHTLSEFLYFEYIQDHKNALTRTLSVLSISVADDMKTTQLDHQLIQQ